MSKDAVPEGAVPLSEALASLRGELTRAWWDGRNAKMRFKPAPIELTLDTAVTRSTGSPGTVSWWLLELGGSHSRESVTTQTITLTLDPVLFDEDGQPIETFIDADASNTGEEPQGEVELDAAE